MANFVLGNFFAYVAVVFASRKPAAITRSAWPRTALLKFGAYCEVDFDSSGRMLTPRLLCARFKPSSCDSLNDLSLKLPMSLTSAALNVAPAAAELESLVIIAAAAASPIAR